MAAPAIQDSIELKITLRCYVRQEDDCWLASCPSVDVLSQGTSQEDAVSSVTEAIQLWFESCIERGVLSQALRELGFRTGPGPEGVNRVELKKIRAEDESVLGKSIPVNISIPAYQAALLTSR